MRNNGIFIGALILVVLVFAGLIFLLLNLQGILNLIGLIPTGVDPANIVVCSEVASCSVPWTIIFILLLTFIILTAFAYTTLLERKVIGWIQQRIGPNRVGPMGLLQPLADAIKLIFKEDIIPAQADKAVYYLAPMLKVVPVLLIFAVVPWGPDILIPWFDGIWYQVSLTIADINVGILWVLAVTSLATYGVVLAGWSSNNKYAMLGGLRASAQMISYELSLGLAMAVPIMIVGSMNLTDIVNAQGNVWEWFVFHNPLAAGILVLTLFAEVSRAPFDLVEAEQELTAGFMTEYSGMKFAMFMMAEYLGMIAVAIIAVSMYFGGFNLIPVDAIPIAGPLNLAIKVVAMLFFFIWVRATLPRIRYDRLMSFGWKVLLPLSIVAVAWTAIAIVIGDVANSSTVYTIVSFIFFVVVVVAGYLILRGSGDEDTVSTEADDYWNDPAITGERRNLGWIAIQVVGFLIAIPFAMVEWTIKVLESSARFFTGESDETAIEVSTDQGAISSSGGD